MHNSKRSALIAKLPERSRAVQAQGLGWQPMQPERGVYYPVPHANPNPRGWRTRRHLKRKNLRRSNRHHAFIDRIGTKWVMLPMVVGFMIFSVVFASLLVTYAALTEVTQQRYGEQVTTLLDILPKDSLKMYDKHGTLIYQMVDQGLQSTVPLSQISPHLVHAEVAIEDQYFWTNAGIDITGIVRALIADLSHQQIVAGGSTITQQLIKNAIVGNQDTAFRKLQELILAPAITRIFTKQQILSMYLNTIYYGEQAYGANAAAFTYFGLKDTSEATAASQLDIAQAAMLAGIPSAPVGRDPFLFPNNAFIRVQQVLHQMRIQGYINIEQERAAIHEVQQPHFLHRGVITNKLPQALHFISYALNELATDLHVKLNDLSRAGLVVSTTLDLPLQNQILKIARSHIAELVATHHMSDAAVVMIDYHNGGIRTLLGNIDPTNRQDGAFDVASDGFRQPGSTFKPIIYATAFSQGVSPGMPVYDTPYTISRCCGQSAYTPHNYDLRYHGLVSYRYALQNSFNVPAVKLLVQTGVDKALATAQSMGITDYIGVPNYTMVLGTLGVHLLDMTSAYGVFANGGVDILPHSIDTVTDVQGNIIYRFSAPGKRVISKQVAFIVTNVLSDNNARLFEFLDCNVLQLYSNPKDQCLHGNRGMVRPAAAKTGTSNDFRDNWTIGYTTDFVMGVWTGNNDNTPMLNVSGIDGAAPIWHDSMLLAEQNLPVSDFANPGGVVLRTIYYPEGITTTDWYLK